ncbi:MAG: hypothetical protein PHN56_01825 [Candidatus Nanoarchaeia archaeon]|nr:hypothetical protein [Candidatus Nanoarchaeia archaeon]
MKFNTIIILIFVVLSFIAGYLTGSFKPNVEDSNIVSNIQNSTLYVLILNSEGLPVNNLEVDLWHDTTTEGPPDVGVSYTNSSGIAVFSIPNEGYLIGFNLLNFPSNFEAVRETPVRVSENFTIATITLHNKI